jgi:hypothetical protein
MNVNGGKGLGHSAIQDAPTGHRPPTQRCGNAPMLGSESNESNNLNEVVAVCARAVETKRPQLRCG